MGKATNGLGQFRGKVGAVVFRVNQGEQIVSAYQPQVRNPKSNLQTAQRNKFYLASQLNKLVSDYDIAGLGATPRNRRSEFVKNIVVNAISTLNDGLFTTSIKEDKVLFSKGSDSGLESLFTANTLTGTSATFGVNFQSTDGIDVSNVAVKIVQVLIKNNEYVGVKSFYLDLPEAGNTKTFNITVPTGTKVVLYAVPIRLKEGYRVVEQKLTQLQYDAATDENKYVVVGEYAESSASYQYYKSFVVASWGNSGDVVSPDEGGDEVVNPDGPNFNGGTTGENGSGSGGNQGDGGNDDGGIVG